MAGLTSKQEAFARLVAEGSSQADAYRSAFNSKAKPESVHVNASKLMSDAKVSLRVEELKQELAEKSLWTRLNSVEVLASIARGRSNISEDGEPVEPARDSDRVNAVKALNSMHGWDKQTIDHTSSDGSMTPSFGALYGTNDDSES